MPSAGVRPDAMVSSMASAGRRLEASSSMSAGVAAVKRGRRRRGWRFPAHGGAGGTIGRGAAGDAAWACGRLGEPSLPDVEGRGVCVQAGFMVRMLFRKWIKGKS